MRILQNRFVYLFILLLFSCLSYSQHYDYEIEARGRLLPKVDSTTTVKASFLSVTYYNPEYSIRLVEINNKYFLEARMMETNLKLKLEKHWAPYFKGEDVGKFTINKYEYITPIKKSFYDKIMKTFTKVIRFDDDSIRPKLTISDDGLVTGARVYDGTTYDYFINVEGLVANVWLNYELESTDYRFLVANAFLEIINDLKDGKFNETKYTIFN